MGESASCSFSFNHDGDRTVVMDGDGHVGAEDASFNAEVVISETFGDGVNQGFGDLRWRSTGKGWPATAAGVSIEGKL